jgi:hypothetical protein
MRPDARKWRRKSRHAQKVERGCEEGSRVQFVLCRFVALLPCCLVALLRSVHRLHRAVKPNIDYFPEEDFGGACELLDSDPRLLRPKGWLVALALPSNL